MAGIEKTTASTGGLADHPTKPLRVAVIGCGAIAEQMHLPVLTGHLDIEVSALVDRNIERAERLAEGYGVPSWFGNATEVTAEVCDAAIVATPPSHHAPCALELIERGIHVLVEKPMATRLADAEAMVDAAERADVVLAIGFFRRLYPSTRLMRQLLEAEEYGRPLRFRIEGGGMYSWAAATLGNMQRDLAGGGVVIDFGSHMIDLMFALFDEPGEVLDYRDNNLGGVEADGTARVRVRWKSETIEGVLEFARTRNLGSFVEVECERGTLRLDVNERFAVHATPSNAASAWRSTVRWRDGASDESWYATFARQFDDWVDAIRKGSEPELSGRSALATARLIESCYEQRKPMAEPWVRWDVPPATANGDLRTTARALTGAYAAGRGRILVTGASGFIGSRLVETLRLREQADVRALVHNPGNASRLARLDVEMVQGDLAHAAEVSRLVADCDAVFHCAIGTSWGEPKHIREVTVGGTARLLEAASEANVQRFLHVSTMAVYGNDSDLTGSVDETQPVRPVAGSVYGETKAAAERAVLSAAAKGLPAVVFRPARVYGPFSRIFIMRPLAAIAASSFRWLGSPDVPADMVYVDTVVEAMWQAAQSPPEKVVGEAFNVGDEDHTTWRDFYADFATHLGLDLEAAPIVSPRQETRRRHGPLAWSSASFRGVQEIVTSPEFKSLGRRVLSTDPVGTLPRWAMESFPALERSARRLVRADDSMPVWEPNADTAVEWTEMGSGGSVLSMEKARRSFGFEPPQTPEEARQLTLEWTRQARIA